MNGILSAIGSWFKKKKDEDQLTPTVQAPPVQSNPINIATNAINTVADTAYNWGGNILKAIGNVKPLPFGPTLAETKVNPVMNVGQLAGMGKDFLQSFPRAGATLVATASDALGGPKTIDVSKGTGVNRLGNAIMFGSEPIKSIQTQQSEASKWLTEKTAHLPVPENIKKPTISGVSFAAPIAMLGVDLMNPVGGGEKKLAVKTTDELATVIKRALPKVASTVDESSGALKVAWESIAPILDKINVDKKLLKNLSEGKMIEGEGYVLKKQGSELVATFDNAFKEVTPKIAGGVEFVKKALTPKAGVELGKAPKVSYVEPQVFADTLDNGAVGSIKKLSELKFPDYAKEAGAIDRNQVEAVKSSILAGDKINPIVVDQSGNVLDGAHRLTALRELGVPEVQTVIQKTKEPIKQSAKEIKAAAKVAEAKLAEETGGATGKLVTEKDFERSMREADSYLKEQFPVTPRKHSAMLDRKARANEKAGQKMLNDWTESYADQTIDLNGKGGLKLSGDIIEGMPKWTDKNRAVLNITTPGRIVEDVAGADAPKLNEFFFDRVGKDTQAIQNDLKGIRESIKSTIMDKLGIAPGSEADKLVFRYGERKMTLDELKEAAPDNWQQIVDADKYFRTLYDTLLTRINDVITKFGYDPVLRRNDYYTHYQELGSIFDQLGIVFRSSELPAWLNGLTQDFKPGKEFFRYAQPRLGDKATESAIGAIDKYLEPALNQIYRTETIQRGRLLERALRDSLQMRDDIADPAHLTNFMGWLGDYVNTLSGKKSLLARGSEALLGRPIYSLVDGVKSKTSANLVGGNISSAVTNFIPLTQAAATTDKPSFFKGLINAATAPLTEANNFSIDGVQSTFLRNRFGVEKLAPTFWQNVGDKATWLFTSIDKFVANTIVGGKYFEGLSKGMNEADAMARADRYAKQIMADRSVGQMPQIFQNQGLLGIITQYQLEVNNQLQYMFRDVPKESPSFLKTASALGQIAVYSYLFNNVFQFFTGRRPAFDPIDIASSSIDEALSNDAPDKKRQNIVKKIADNLPFIQIFTQGGRIPLAAGIPSASDLSTDPLGALFKFGMLYGSPVGGYQIYKTVEGVKALAKGYEEDSSGKVRYPIDQNLMNVIRGTLFGKYAFPEATTFFDKRLSPLGYDQTIIIKNLLDKDPEAARTYYANFIRYRELTSQVSRMNDEKNQLRVVLADPNVSNDDKRKAYQNFLTTVNQIRKGLVDAANENTVQPDTTMKSIDTSLIKSATDGLPVPASDFLKDVGALPMGGIGKKVKGVKFKVKVPKISTKAIKFKMESAKKKTPDTKPVSLTPPTYKLPTPPGVRGLRVS